MLRYLKKSLYYIIIVCGVIPALVLYVLPGAVAIGEESASDTEWPQFMNTTAHTANSDSILPDIPELLWQSEVIGAVDASSVTVAENRVFVNCKTALTALDVETGRQVWSVPADIGGQMGSWSTPVYSDGAVFINGEGAYDAFGGAVLWNDILPDNTNGSPLVVDDRVYIGDWDGHHYYCYDARNGTEKWVVEVEGSAQGTPAYSEGNLYLTSWEYVGGNVYCVNAGNGQVLWHKDLSLDTCGSPAVQDGIVYVTTYNFNGDGDLYALDGTDGSIVWGPITIQRSSSTPAISCDRVYVCGGCYGFSDRQVYCFDADDGSLIWETATDLEIGDWTCSVAVADGCVMVGKTGKKSAFKETYMLDAEDGQVLWSYAAGGSSPAIAGGRIFTIGDGCVLCFGESTVPFGMHYYELDITVSSSAEGSVESSPLPGEHGYEEDTEVTLTATPTDGYTFTGWTGDADGTETGITITMDSDKEVTACFSALSDTTGEEGDAVTSYLVDTQSDDDKTPAIDPPEGTVRLNLRVDTLFLSYYGDFVTGTAQGTFGNTAVEVESDDSSLLLYMEATETHPPLVMKVSTAEIPVPDETVELQVQGVELETDDTQFESGSVVLKAGLSVLPETIYLQPVLIGELDEMTAGSFAILSEVLHAPIRDIALAVDVQTGFSSSFELDSATIVMKVPREWVEQQGSIESICILHCADSGDSDILDTVFTGYDAQDRAVFEAESPQGFSVFALVAMGFEKTSLSGQPENTQEPDAERIEAVAAVTGEVSQNSSPESAASEDRNTGDEAGVEQEEQSTAELISPWLWIRFILAAIVAAAGILWWKRIHREE